MVRAQKIDTEALNQRLIGTPAVQLRPKLSIMSQIQRERKGGKQELRFKYCQYNYTYTLI